MQRYIRSFIHHEAAGGILLMFAALLAILCANTGFAGLYQAFLETPVQLSLTIQTELYGLSKTILVWINDGFMTLFFLLVGLEIKREWIDGELSSRSRALQPMLAALGGIIVPVALFFLVNHDDRTLMRGWAIPCATDIAFALGVLALLGSRIPLQIKVLLTAIAVLDDLAAILIIALFYSGQLQTDYLTVSLVGFALLAGLSTYKSRHLWLYMLSGLLVWYGFLKTGIHPTMAGVVTALFVPLRTEHRGEVISPLHRLEHGLHPWVIFGVMPLFAFANAGLDLQSLVLADLRHDLSLGILLGLVVGKPLGVMAGLAFGHVTRLAPVVDLRLRDYLGVAMLCGVGFTMSLFIGELAFETHDQMQHVKLGVLAASLVAAVTGYLISRFHFNSKGQVNV